MRITRFWAKGYRSLRDVALEGFGPFVVFYGPNGSGKSNVLRGIETVLAAAGVWASYERPGTSRFAKALAAEGVLGPDDRFRGASKNALQTVLGVELDGDAAEGINTLLSLGQTLPSTLRIEVTVLWDGAEPMEATLDCSFDGVAGDVAEAAALRAQPGTSLRATLARVAREAFWKVTADRSMRDETLALTPVAEDAAKDSDVIRTALREGRVQTAVFHAKNDWDASNRRRFEAMRTLLAKTLGLPAMDVGRDPKTGHIDLRQPLGKGDADISLRSAGLGVENVVGVVAAVLFARCRTVAVEEPEAHLHARTSARALRDLLLRLVDPGDGERAELDQLFIATHSNLFDLDASGFWDVAMEDGATVVRRKPLDELDARHLYEPGPARHALLRSLEYLDPSTVVFRRLTDSTAVTAAEMCDLLRCDAREADDYLAAVYASAVRSVRRLAANVDGRPERPT